MILSKINKLTLIIFLLLCTQCYKDPFFELNVKVQDQNSNPVSNVVIKIEITDLNDGTIIEDNILGEYFEETTGEDGEASFSFDNKALITARVCSENLFCAEGHIYLEENKTKELKLMLQSSTVENSQCSYCN